MKERTRRHGKLRDTGEPGRSCNNRARRSLVCRDAKRQSATVSTKPRANAVPQPGYEQPGLDEKRAVPDKEGTDEQPSGCRCSHSIGASEQNRGELSRREHVHHLPHIGIGRIAGGKSCVVQVPGVRVVVRLRRCRHVTGSARVGKELAEMKVCASVSVTGISRTCGVQMRGRGEMREHHPEGENQEYQFASHAIASRAFVRNAGRARSSAPHTAFIGAPHNDSQVRTIRPAQKL